jgi:hypothetical protein
VQVSVSSYLRLSTRDLTGTCQEWDMLSNELVSLSSLDLAALSFHTGPCIDQDYAGQFAAHVRYVAVISLITDYPAYSSYQLKH